MFNTNDKETSINKLEFKNITTKQKEQIENIIQTLEWNNEIRVQDFLFSLNRVDATLFIGAFYALKNYSKAKDKEKIDYYTNLIQIITKMWGTTPK